MRSPSIHTIAALAVCTACAASLVSCKSDSNAADATAPGAASASAAPAAPLNQAPAGWKSLFNGKDLSGWKPFLGDSRADPKTVWSVQNGVLVCEGNPVGYISTVTPYTSYELELEWRFDAEKGEGNSGVLLRVQNPDKVWPRSVEAQLQSKNAGDIWNIGDFPMKTAPERTKARWTGKMKPTNEKPLGEWNKYRIVLNGGSLELWVNGVLQNSATGVQVVPGRIALQSEGAHIEFRNIYIKTLD